MANEVSNFLQILANEVSNFGKIPCWPNLVTFKIVYNQRVPSTPQPSKSKLKIVQACERAVPTIPTPKKLPSPWTPISLRKVTNSTPEKEVEEVIMPKRKLQPIEEDGVVPILDQNPRYSPPKIQEQRRRNRRFLV